MSMYQQEEWKTAGASYGGLHEALISLGHEQTEAKRLMLLHRTVIETGMPLVAREMFDEIIADKGTVPEVTGTLAPECDIRALSAAFAALEAKGDAFTRRVPAQPVVDADAPVDLHSALLTLGHDSSEAHRLVHLHRTAVDTGLPLVPRETFDEILADKGCVPEVTGTLAPESDIQALSLALSLMCRRV